jgi:tape measure domain-containing protein
MAEEYSIDIKVDSTQAKNAAKDLDKLAEASDKTEGSLKKTGKAASASAKDIADATKAIAHLKNEYRDAAGVIDNSNIGAKLGMGGKKVVPPDIANELNRIANQSSITEAALGKVGDAAKYVRSAFVLFVGIEIARFMRDTAGATIEAADAYTNMKSKLDIATYSQQELNKAFEDSFNIANKYYTSVTDVAAAYAKFNPIVASLGRNTADTAKIVESLSASLLISGNNTVDAAETFRQFAQAISGPKVQMEEMNTIIDSNQALWRGLQREFPDIIAKYGSLKEAISKQAISNEMLIDATIKLGDEFEALAARRVPTIANAMSVLNNAYTQYVGEADDASGASAALAGVILDLAESLRNVEGKGETLASVINVIAQSMAGTRGVIADYIDLINGLSDAYLAFTGRQAPAAGADPEIARLMQMAQGQVPIDQLAAPSRTKPTTQPQLTPKGVGGGTSAKQASKEAKDALDAFKAMIAAQISAAENSEKVFAAMSANSRKRYDIEADQIRGIAELKIRATKSETMRLSIAEEAQAKIVESINQETDLRQAALNKEIETVNVKLAGVQHEIDAADAHKLKQAERLELTTKQADLETELAVKRAERTQIELDAIGQIQDAEQSLAEARQQAEEALVREEALRQLEIMSSNLEYAKEMATGLAEAFGEVGAAIGGMSIALAEYDKQAATIEIARKEAVDKAEGDQKRIDEINQDSAQKQSRAQIKMYGDMTKAAQGFFKQGTKGYDALGTAVKVFRAFEVAQSVMSTVKQMEQMGGLFNSFIEMLTQMGILSAANTAKEITQSTAKASAKAAEGAANQGSSGDPYSAFARVAAWIALMAGLGIAIGGGGGSSAAAAPVPDMTGMGTVKGDPMAISESISKSLDILTENSSNDLNYSADMLQALLDIKSALGAAADDIATSIQPLIGGLVSQFGSDAVKQAGFLIGPQNLNRVLQSGLLKGQVGARIETESSMLGVTIKKGQTLITDYSNKIAKAFGEVVRSIAQGINEVGKVIGVTDEEIAKRLSKFKVNIGKIDIAGLSAEEAAKKIEAAFSAMSDTMAMKALPEFKDFQRVGEGYMETITRVAEGINRATGELERLGMEAINYSEIENKRGDVAAEIARQTIIAQSDLGEGAKKYVDQLTGSLEDIIDSYKKLAEITRLINAVGLNGQSLDRTIVNAAGGLDELQTALEDYYDRFLNDQEKVAAQTERLQREFASLGIAMPQTNEDFRKLLGSLDLNSEAGKKLFGRLIGLSGAFADLTDAIAEQQSVAQEVAAQAEEERKRLEQERLSTLQKAIDNAFSAMQKAYQDLTSIQDRFIKLSKSLRSYMDELVGPASQTISPEQRYFLARQEFERIRSLAGTGNEEALGALASVSKTFLDASRNYNASSEAYQSDLAMVVAAVEASTQYADDQVALADQALTVAKAQYDRLGALNGTMGQVNASVLSVGQGIASMNVALGNYAAAVASKQAELTSQLAAAQAAAAAAQAAAAAAANTGNAVPIPRPTPSAPIPTAFGPANPARGFQPSQAKAFMTLDYAKSRVEFLYQQLLNRSAEEPAKTSLANELGNARITEAQAVASIRASAEYNALIARGFVPGFARGGAFGPGLAMVGEQGPEMVSFNGSGHISSAGATSNFFAGIRDAITITSSQQTELLKEQVNELQALVRLQAAANRELINQLSEIRTETAESTRLAKVEASA